MGEMTMTKLLVKYTKYTEYEVPIESNNVLEGQIHAEDDMKVRGLIDEGEKQLPNRYEIDSWMSYDDHVVITEEYDELKEILCGSSDTWTHGEVLERARQAIDALRREEDGTV